MTLPVSEDAYATSTRKAPALRVTPAAGTAATLRVSGSTTPLIRFEAGSLADDYPASEVSRALLMIYFPKVTKAGEIAVHPVTSDWTEAPGGTVAGPVIDVTPIATIPADSVIAKQFAIVDVTEQVKSWLTTPASDFGLAFSATGATSAELGAKEGPASGYPAVLQIERTRVVTNGQLAPGIDAVKLGDGSVSNTELSYLDGATSVLQPQIDGLKDGLEDGLEDAAATAATKVSKSGDTMTGALVLPANGIKVGDNQLATANGKVGIGTATPSAALEVRGDIKLGSAGNLQATSGEESLRIVRGAVHNENGTLGVLRGEGFTLTQVGSDASITFSTPFAEPPVITMTQETTLSTSAKAEATLENVSETGVLIPGLNISGLTINFVAIGPR